MSTTPPDGPSYEPPAPGQPPTPPPGAPPSAGGWGGATPPPPPAGPGGTPWSVGQALSYGWSTFTANLGPLLLAGLVLLVGVALLQGVGWVIRGILLDEPEFDMATGRFSEGSGLIMSQLAGGVSSLLFYLIYTIICAVIVRGALDLTEGRPLDLGGLFSRINLGNVVVLALITGVIVSVGTVLCVLPGLVAWFFFSYATFFLVDRDLSPVQAITASVAFVRDHLGDTLLWFLMTMVVTTVGLCLCLVGIVVAAPVTLIGTAFTYKRLTGQPVA